MARLGALQAKANMTVAADNSVVIAGLPQAAEQSVLEISSGEVLLAGEDTGGARSLVLAHGLTATRRYVLHGSRLLERAGYRVVSYDARGHALPSLPPLA